ncbi:cob(I)yrinic acid a,c-diamide adenosyltransferase [Marinicrinis sediminis]|uniref:Corrinoid adenosyltransferase n=1 Tax=Marinicrinis sediminis TaxID=1652465 RepID=A0ABW5R8H3_9BACL
MKIYTRTGDEGQTHIIGGRVAKNDARVEAYGTIDELNSFVGLVISQLDEKVISMKPQLIDIQHELFDCGADLAAVKPGPKGYKVHAEMTQQLEQWIDAYEAENTPITRFILPGGTAVSAGLHVCRTICRRAERSVVALAAEKEINTEVRAYLNRLSDLFFAMARAANLRAGEEDVSYVRSAEVFRRDS